LLKLLITLLITMLIILKRPMLFAVTCVPEFTYVNRRYWPQNNAKGVSTPFSLPNNYKCQS
jgi:hypothetical protein